MTGANRQVVTVAGMVMFMLLSVSAFSYPNSAVMIPGTENSAQLKRSGDNGNDILSKRKAIWFRKKSARGTGVNRRLAAGDIHDGYIRGTRAAKRNKERTRK